MKQKLSWMMVCSLLLSLLLPGAGYAAKSDDIIKTALKYRGAPYVFGAPMKYAPRAFDCSSFTKYVFAKNGIKLPRTASAQSKKGKYIPTSRIKKGDLLFFRVPGRGIGHVGIYAGGNRMIHTYGKGGVKVSKINGYWRSHYLGAKRVI